MSSLATSGPTTDSRPTPEGAGEGTGKASGKWAKRAGIGVFLFFLIKGLLWLIVPPALILGARFFAQ